MPHSWGEPTSGTITPLGRVCIWDHSHPWDHPASGTSPPLGPAHPWDHPTPATIPPLRPSHLWDHPTSGMIPPLGCLWAVPAVSPSLASASPQLPGCTAHRRTRNKVLGIADELWGGCFLLAQTFICALCHCTEIMSGAEWTLLHGRMDLECSFCHCDAHGEESSPALGLQHP